MSGGREVKSVRVSFLLLFFSLSLRLFAQEGGAQGIFTSGVGARALGLGGAYVAYPQDPTAIFWNPAGLDHLQQKSLTLFHTSLPAGAKYNFIGYVHPTINIGTFGIGMLRIGVGDIPERDEYNLQVGTFSFSQTELLFSYSKQIPFSLSIGLNFKVESQSFSTRDKKSDLGVGVDLGILYKPEFTNLLLRNSSLGLCIQNAVSPRLKPGERTDYIPHNIKFGIAKLMPMGRWGSGINLFLDFDKGDIAPLKFHLGSEYLYQGKAMLRFGINDGQFAFGAGAVLGIFQLDYSYGRFSENEFSPNHRLSLTVSFGKTKAELIKLAQEKRMREIEEEVVRRAERERQERIATLMAEGKQCFESQDYLSAQVKFSQILELDRGNRQAQEWLAKTNEKIRKLQERELAERMARIRAERERKEIKKFVEEHFNKGLKFYEKGDYNRAIAEWKTALTKQPDNELIGDYVKKAKAALIKKIKGLIRKADTLAKKKKYTEAIDLLKQAEALGMKDEELKRRLGTKIASLEKRMNFLDFYEQGLTYYQAGNYRAAMEAFKKARALEPTNERIKYYYREAEARALARDQEMPPEVLRRFNKALNLYMEGKYEKAIDIWEELRSIQPYNKRILNAIDRAKAELQKRHFRNKGK